MQQVQAELRQRRGITIMMAIVFLLLVIGFITGGLALVLFAPPGLGNTIFGSVLICLGLLIGFLMTRTVAHIELTSDRIITTRWLVRWSKEYELSELETVLPLRSATSPLATAITDAWLKTSNRGYQLRFSGRREVNLIRGDMIDVDVFMEQLKEVLGTKWKIIQGN